MRARTLSRWLTTAFLCCGWSIGTFASENRNTPEVKAIERSKLSVVNIHSEKLAHDKESFFNDGTSRKVNGMGTGIVIDERGYIVTNQHVIADVESLRVTLFDGSTYTARVISYDRKHDLAIIKIDPTRPLKVAPLGTSSDLMLGETVIAVGNAFGYEHTVTKGIVSALHRDVEVNDTQSYKNLIQTDASINPGNSGGPLINLDGELIGINVAIRAGAQRIGFAIPIDDARKFIAKLLNTTRLNDTYHGLLTHDVKVAASLKLLVDNAEPGSPASTAGFKTGDVVVQAGSVPVSDQADLERAFLGHNAGEAVDIVVERESERVLLKVELVKAPSTVADATAAARAREQVVARPVAASTADDAAWRTLGVKLVKLPPQTLEAMRTRYRGGMKVTDVRPDSPAARSGIKRGDVLVGLHVWETITQDNVSYILSHPELSKYNPLKFWIVRGQEELFGHLRLVSASK